MSRPNAGERENLASVALNPCGKGTSLLPLLAALKNLPNRNEVVPAHLHKYFSEHILVSGWYPERDFFVLMEALVSTIDPKSVGGDTWAFLGISSAQRDIAGMETPGAAHTKGGLYQNFLRVEASDVEQLFRKAVRLWPQYHDTGAMEIRGGHVATNALVARLTGFQIPIDGYLRLQSAYMEEYARLVGIALTGKVIRSTARGEPFCEWEYTLTRTPESEAFIASLPALSR